MGLAAEGGFDGAHHLAERRGVRGVGEGVEGGFLLAVRKVELARGARGEVGGDDAVEFVAEGLDCDCGGGGSVHVRDGGMGVRTRCLDAGGEKGIGGLGAVRGLVGVGGKVGGPVALRRGSGRGGKGVSVDRHRLGRCRWRLLKVCPLEDGNGGSLDVPADLVGVLLLDACGGLFFHGRSPLGSQGDIRRLGLLEPLDIVAVPEEELEVLGGSLNVDQVVHKVAGGARLGECQ